MDIKKDNKKFVCAEQEALKEVEENGNEQKPLSLGANEVTSSLAELNLNDENEDDDSYNAPVEILAEFLSAYMSQDYTSALYYCRLILEYEPENKTIQDFYPLIQEKIRIEAAEESDEDFDECNNESNYATRSENSTEYFSSDSVGTENTSACSSLSSEEDDASIKSSE